MALKTSTAFSSLILSFAFILPSFGAVQQGSVSAVQPADTIKPATQVVQSKHSSAKTAHRVTQTRHHKIAYYGKNFLVPPPPPYTPSMLPELQYGHYSQSSQRTDSAEESSPYNKYIYTRSGYEPPKPVQPNKYVTYWANKT
jgi:hypothetical protein